jgi:hypothetical protein
LPFGGRGGLFGVNIRQTIIVRTYVQLNNHARAALTRGFWKKFTESGENRLESRRIGGI